MRSLIFSSIGLAIISSPAAAQYYGDGLDDLRAAVQHHREVQADFSASTAYQRQQIERYQSQPFIVRDQYGQPVFRGSVGYR